MPPIEQLSDRATSLRQHLANFALHTVPYAAQVHGHHAFEFVVAGLQKRGRLGIHPGIIESSVEPAIGADSAGDHRLDLGGIRHVTGHTNCVVTRCTKALGRLADRHVDPDRQGSRRPSLGKGLCRR